MAATGPNAEPQTRPTLDPSGTPSLDPQDPRRLVGLITILRHRIHTLWTDWEDRLPATPPRLWVEYRLARALDATEQFLEQVAEASTRYWALQAEVADRQAELEAEARWQRQVVEQAEAAIQERHLELEPQAAEILASERSALEQCQRQALAALEEAEELQRALRPQFAEAQLQAAPRYAEAGLEFHPEQPLTHLPDRPAVEKAGDAARIGVVGEPGAERGSPRWVGLLKLMPGLTVGLSFYFLLGQKLNQNTNPLVLAGAVLAGVALAFMIFETPFQIAHRLAKRRQMAFGWTPPQGRRPWLIASSRAIAVTLVALTTALVALEANVAANGILRDLKRAELVDRVRRGDLPAQIELDPIPTVALWALAGLVSFTLAAYATVLGLRSGEAAANRDLLALENASRLEALRQDPKVVAAFATGNWVLTLQAQLAQARERQQSALQALQALGQERENLRHQAQQWLEAQLARQTLAERAQKERAELRLEEIAQEKAQLEALYAARVAELRQALEDRLSDARAAAAAFEADLRAYLEALEREERLWEEGEPTQVRSSFPASGFSFGSARRPRRGGFLAWLRGVLARLERRRGRSRTQRSGSGDGRG